MPTESLLLAAFPPEFGGLDLDLPPGWAMACTGVGALTAAVNTSRMIAKHQPDRVLFIGTCGAYDKRLEISDLLCASEAVAISLDELEGRAYRPRIERTRWTADWILPFPAHPVLVPPAITVCGNGAGRLGELAPAEHLELTGVFAACHAARVPVGAALVVVNRVGPNAHEEWKANHAAGSAKLAAALRKAGIF